MTAEERFLLAQPPLSFLPQPRRKQSPKSVAVPGSGTHLAPGLQRQQLQGQGSPLAQPCGLLQPAAGNTRQRRARGAVPRLLCPLQQLAGASGQPARWLPEKVVWVVGGRQGQSSAPLCGDSPHLSCPQVPCAPSREVFAQHWLML